LNIILQRVKKPQLFWVSAIAPITCVVVGGVFTYLVKGTQHGIQIVSYLKYFFFFNFLVSYLYKIQLFFCSYIWYLMFINM